MAPKKRGRPSEFRDRRSIEVRSEEHTSELQHSQISYAVFCLKKKKQRREVAEARSKGLEDGHVDPGPLEDLLLATRQLARARGVRVKDRYAPGFEPRADDACRHVDVGSEVRDAEEVPVAARGEPLIKRGGSDVRSAGAVGHLGDGADEAVDIPTDQGNSAVPAGQLLRGSHGALGLTLVIAGEERERPARNAATPVGLLDGQRHALVDR